MPTVTLNRDVFEKLVGKKFDDVHLKERISMLGTDLENLDKKQIVVEVFPNRPDMLSEQGFARAFSGFIGAETGLKSYSVKKSGFEVIVDSSVSMRPYTACALIRNLSLNDQKIREIMQMQEKLAMTHGRNRKKSCYGIYPAEHIKFPVHYTAKDLKSIKFRPLGFDKEITGLDIENLHPTGKKYKSIAKEWGAYPCYLDDSGNVLSLIPYTNSHDTGKIDLKTRDIFIECTGSDLQNVTIALNIFVSMFAEMGGDIFSLEIVYPNKVITTPNLTPRKMKLDIKYVNKILGTNLLVKEAVKYLARMGFGYEKGSALIPAYRADILHQVDLIEDIAIAYGYENLQHEIPSVATVAAEDALYRFSSQLGELLIGLGCQELKNYHLLSDTELAEKMEQPVEAIPLKNSLGEHNHLRNSLLPGLLRVLGQNQHHDYPQKVFETGIIFHRDPKAEDGVREQVSLGVGISHEKADLTSIRQVIDIIGNGLDLKFDVKETKDNSFIRGRIGKLFLGKNCVGKFGEIRPEVLEKWKLVMPVAMAELDLDLIFREVITP
jgi:phenylalanyl-tRNA synthetase beta chain